MVKRVSCCLLLFALAACAPGSKPSTSAPAPSTPASAPTGMGSATREAPYDARFIDSMIPHHEMAVTMSRDALPRLAHAELRAKAQDIIDAQQREIATMRGWRAQWYPSLATTAGLGMPMSAGGDHAGGDHGEAAMPMPAATATAAADGAFIDAMIPHHQAAIDMATQALSRAEHAELRSMAQAIIDAQSAEIAQMKAWRSQWFGH